MCCPDCFRFWKFLKFLNYWRPYEDHGFKKWFLSLELDVRFKSILKNISPKNLGNYTLKSIGKKGNTGDIIFIKKKFYPNVSV